MFSSLRSWGFPRILEGMAARLTRSGRVVLEEGDTTRVLGRVEETSRGWLALTAEGQRIYGPKGPVFPAREAAAQAVAAVSPSASASGDPRQ